jgi:hypothetical protein
VGERLGEEQPKHLRACPVIMPTECVKAQAWIGEIQKEMRGMAEVGGS